MKRMKIVMLHHNHPHVSSTIPTTAHTRYGSTRKPKSANTAKSKQQQYQHHQPIIRETMPMSPKDGDIITGIIAISYTHHHHNSTSTACSQGTA